MTKLIVTIIVAAVVAGGLGYLLLRGRGTVRTGNGEMRPARPGQSTTAGRHDNLESERWGFFLCNVNDKIASIFLDLGIHDRAPITEQATIAFVFVDLLDPHENGLIGDSEFEALKEIDDRLSAHLSKDLDATFVGRITTDGRREFYFYCRSADGLERTAEHAMAEYPQYQYECGSESDPDWSQYFKVLYPNEWQYQTTQNQRVVEVLRDHGDTLKKPRDVIHWAYFKNAEARTAFVDQMTSAGFAVYTTSDPEDKDADAEFPFGAAVNRDDMVDHNSIDDTVWRVYNVAVTLGGNYDGWEAQVVKD